MHEGNVFESIYRWIKIDEEKNWRKLLHDIHKRKKTKETEESDVVK